MKLILPLLAAKLTLGLSSISLASHQVTADQAHCFTLEEEDELVNKALPLDDEPVETQLLATVESEPEKNLLHDLRIGIDEHGDIAQVYRTSSTSRQVITPDELLQGEVVLASAEGRKALLISCSNCDRQLGGRVVLRYLVNGIFMHYGKFKVDLKKDAAGQWAIYTLKKERIHKLRLESNRLLGRLVGISKVRVVHQ